MIKVNVWKEAQLSLHAFFYIFASSKTASKLLIDLSSQPIIEKSYLKAYFGFEQANYSHLKEFKLFLFLQIKPNKQIFKVKATNCSKKRLTDAHSGGGGGPLITRKQAELAGGDKTLQTTET